MTRADHAETPAAAADPFAGGGAMGDRMRALDWSATPLGPVAGWPPGLRSALGIGLNSNFPIAVYWGRDLVLLYNDEWSPILGDKHPWALGRPAQEAWPEIWHIIEPLFGRVMTTGEAVRSRDQLLPMHRHGFTEECYFDYTFSPIRGEGGTVEGVFNAVLETTTRVIGERRLRTLRGSGAAEAAGRTAADACRAAARTLAENPYDLPFVLLYLLDADGRRATLAGMTGLDLSGPASPAAVELDDPFAAWPFDRAAATGKPIEVEGLADRFGPLPGGAWPESPRRAVVLPMTTPGLGTPAGFVIAGVSPRLALDDAYRGFLDLVAGHVGTAVANARAFEDQRRRAEALAEIDRAKTAFFSNVSHEFRTPLTLMLGPVDELLRRPAGEVPAGDREQLEVVRRNGRRLGKLVNTLLDFSRIEAGRTRAAFAPTDLAALTADLASNFRSACEAAGVRLAVDCPPLPGPVHVDRGMWEKVVLNLLSNAFKFTFAGEIRVAVRADNGGRAVLTVADTGTGIPAADLPRVFDRFHRVEGSRGRTHEGTGIGLALVRELVHLHGGEAGVESEVGRGTTFTVSVPFGTAHLPADQLADAPAAGGDTDAFVEEALGWLPSELGMRNAECGMEERLGSSDSAFRIPHSALPRVLLADDNADMRGYVRRLLAGRYAVEAVADGAAALAAARAWRPDLVLTDVMMPRLDGFGLLAALRADPILADVPVVLVSARAGEEARVEGLRAGADDYLVKPFAAGELVARVDGLLALAAARREADARRAETVNVLENIGEGFAALDRDWRITYFNAAAERLNGVRREDVLGRTHWELYPATIGTELERQYRRAMADRVPARFENHYEPWDRWFEVNIHPMTDGGLAVYWRDVTAFKQAEAALREKDERLTLLTDHATDYAIVLTDPAGVVTDWLAGADGITGWTAAEAVGGPAHVIFTPEDRAAGIPERELAKAAADGRAEDRRWHLRKDGTRFFADGVTIALRDEAGGLRGFGKVFRDATAAELSDEWLRESEERFRELADAMPQIVYVSGPDGRIEFVNRRWAAYTGQAAADAADLPAVVHPDDLPGLSAAWAAASAAKETLEYEFRLRRADGAYRWFLTRSVPIRDGAGAVARWYGTSTDIHEQKRAEEALRDSEALFRELADTAPAVTWTTDPDGQCTYLSRRWYETTGQTEAEGLGRGWTDAAHPDDRARAAAEFVAASAARRPFAIDYRLRQEDGSYRWAVDVGRPRFGPDGAYLGMVGNVFDVHDRKAAEDRLADSEARFRELCEAAPVAISVSRVGTQLYVNRAYRELYGFPPDADLAGTPILDQIAPRDREMIADRVRRRADGEPVPNAYEFTGLRADGTEFVASIHVGALRLPDGPASVSFASDVTDRVRAGEALRASEARQAYLVGLTDVVRPLADPAAVKAAAARVLGEHLGVDRAFYAEVDGDDWVVARGYERGPVPLPDGRYPAGTYGPWIMAAYRAGERIVFRDTGADPRFAPAERAAHAAAGVIGAVGVPLVKGGRLVAILAVHTDAPRDWADDEVGLVEETAERTWAAVERATAEAALRASEERLRLATEGAGVGTWELDLVAGRGAWSAEAVELFGAGRADFTAADWVGAVHPDDRDRAAGAWRRAVEADAPYEIEFRAATPAADGGDRWLLSRGRVERDAGGRPVRGAGVLLDVTARKRAEAAVRAADERAELVRRATGVGFWYCDLPFDVLQWDDRVKEHFWLPPDAPVTIGTFYDRIHPDDRGPTRAAIDRSITAREGYDIDYRTVDPATGAERWVRAIGRTGYAPDGTPARFDGVTLDVTARKRAEQALRDADRRKDEFLALLAHELRNPLAPLRNGLQVLRLAGVDGEVAGKAREMMDRQLTHMVRLIDDLLDVSRITREKMELRKAPTTLADVVAAAVEAAGPVVEAAGHALTVSVPDAPIPLDADLTRLAQVVSNLLTNSAKYTPRGGRVWLTAARDGGAAVVTVRDTGLGIPAEFLPRLFDMFSQVDRSVEKATGGLGIGLALVKGLTEMHGGTVTAESPGPGKGSTFTVRLPTIAEFGLRNAESSPQPGTVGSGLHSAFRNPNSAIKRRVLVVDDNRDSAESMAEMLRLLGNEVAMAHDGLAAVEAAGRVRPDLVLMDIGMPRLNGLDATRRIRREPWGGGMTVIALTGWGQDDDRERSRAAGCDGHLVKPVSLADLEAAVGRPRDERNGPPG